MLTSSILLDTARETAVLAGKLAREKWERPLEVRTKGFRDLVTDGDLAAQKLITDTIGDRFPDHGFQTEEVDATLPATGPVVWIIDPIDGTTNYSRQNPIFCVSIAAAVPVNSEQSTVNSQQPTASSQQPTVNPSRTQDQQSTINRKGVELVAGYRVVAGAVYAPMHDELFSAAAGQGATLDDRRGQRRLQVSAVNDLAEAVIALDWSHNRRMRQSSLDAIQTFGHQVHSIRAMGSAALAMAWLAAGRLDGYLNYNLQPWDVAAAGLILEEAGGALSDSLGHPLGKAISVGSCVATNGRIHQDFLRVLVSKQ